jgi:hypothetical protein
MARLEDRPPRSVLRFDGESPARVRVDETLPGAVELAENRNTDEPLPSGGHEGRSSSGDLPAAADFAARRATDGA